jgi:hypothetical protein
VVQLSQTADFVSALAFYELERASRYFLIFAARKYTGERLLAKVQNRD